MKSHNIRTRDGGGRCFRVPILLIFEIRFYPRTNLHLRTLFPVPVMFGEDPLRSPIAPNTMTRLPDPIQAQSKSV